MRGRQWHHGHSLGIGTLGGAVLVQAHPWLLIGLGVCLAVGFSLVRNGLRRTGSLADAATNRLNADANLPAGWAPCAECGVPHYRRSPFCSSECQRGFRLKAVADNDPEWQEVPY